MSTSQRKYGLTNQGLIATTGFVFLVAPVCFGQASRIPRMPDGRPNLNGIWQTMNTANWDVLPHSPAPGRVVTLGAEDSMPPGIGVVEGGEIPYLAAAAAKKQENYKNRLTEDPEL